MQPNPTNIKQKMHQYNHFAKLCKWGNLEEAQQFLNENPTINISANNNYIFRQTIKYCNNLETIKWLLKIKPNIDANKILDEVFMNSCKNENAEMVQWLFHLKYELENI